MSSFENGFSEKDNESEKEDKEEYDLDEIIKNERSGHIFDKLDKIQGLRFDKDLALKLIDADEMSIFCDNLSKFQGLGREIALKLIESNVGYAIFYNLDRFEGLDYREIALKGIEEGEGSHVACNLDKFGDKDHQEIALRLIEKSCTDDIAKNIIKFHGLNQEIALHLAQKNQAKCVINNPQSFAELDYNEIALKLIEKGEGELVIRNLSRFGKLDHKVVILKLIEMDRVSLIFKNIDKFAKTDLDQEGVLKFLEKGAALDLLENFEKFQVTDYEDILFRIIEKENIQNMSFFSVFFEKFKHLSQKAAIKLIESGEETAMSCYLSNFDNLDYKQICEKLIERKKYSACAAILPECDGGILDSEIAFQLIDSGFAYKVVQYSDKFNNLNLDEAVPKIIEENEFITIALNIDKFKSITLQELALKAVEMEKGFEILQNLEIYKDIDLQTVISKIAESKSRDYIFYHINNLPILNQEIVLKLLKNGANVANIENDIDRFSFCPDFFEKVKEIYPEFLSKIENISPKVAERAKNSPILVISILSQKDTNVIDKNPFLLQALENNPRFGSKMLIKFKEFDETSKENISILYENKAEILEKSPDIDPGSFEFRQLMQDRLLNYKNNHKIVSSLVDAEFVKEAESKIRKESPWIVENEEKLEKMVQAKLDVNKSETGFADNEADHDFMARIEDEVLDENPDISAALGKYDKMMMEVFDAYINSPDYEDKTEEGIKSLEWLNHNEVIEFTLGEEDVRFSEKVKTPINRIEEVLNKYKETISKILSEYSVELKAVVVANPEEEEVNKYIAGMEEQLILAKNNGEDKKVMGIEKGIVNAKSKLEKLKPINVWEKIQADMRRLSLMIGEASAANKLCVEVESKVQALIEEKNKEELIKTKGALEKDARNLKEKFKTLESFIDTFGVNLESNITGSLGSDRTEALMQEINLEMAEDFSHYDSDKKTLASIFGSEDEKNPLDGTDMSVRIASRDPDVDLYLGNYCPCCVCIESEYHGEESPIVDYVTDLGMQNVVVYDEKRKIPVVSCWCFIGEDRKIGEQVLVIDNIEANTMYSGNYPEQISKAIKEYIEKYAKACKIEHIIQGPDNNDLKIFNLGKVDEKFGGIYNRPGGYFLEAEKEEDDEEEDEEG